jgi:hypothetical protein
MRISSRLLLLCIAATTCVCFNTRALSVNETHWLRDARGCRAYNPNPNPTAGESIRWSGGCKGGYAEGPGLLEWIDKSGGNDGSMKGTFVHGNLQNVGEAQYVEGGHYKGQFRDSLPNGHGTYVFADGTRYDGEFQYGLAEGHGTIVWPNGTRFEGEFKASKRNGHGIIVGPSGARFEGEFKDDRVSGRGTITWPDGHKFEGDIPEELCSGAAALSTANAGSRNCTGRDAHACESPRSTIAHSPNDQGQVSANA